MFDQYLSFALAIAADYLAVILSRDRIGRKIAVFAQGDIPPIGREKAVDGQAVADVNNP